MKLNIMNNELTKEFLYSFLGILPLLQFVKNANSKWECSLIFIRFHFAMTGVCVLCALTSVGALFYFRRL